MDIQATALALVKETLRNPAFQHAHKTVATAFVRNRKLNFISIVSMILRMVKKSLQIECNWLGDFIEEEPASKQAFSHARQKVSPKCFQELHAKGLEGFYNTAPNVGLWYGYRVIAADASTLVLPETRGLAKKFGRGPSSKGSNEAPPMARISEFSDMATKLVISGRIRPYATSEQALAQEQLPEVIDTMRKLRQKTLLFVYDRGYPSEEFMLQHLREGVDFVFRVPKNYNAQIRQAYEQGEEETFLLREGLPLLRLLNFELPSGESELLLTTLTDDRLFSQEVLGKLYHGRWLSMEEGYKKQKIMMQLENFSGKTKVSIEQEYWATLLVGNIIEMGCTDIEGYWIPGEEPEHHVNRSVVFGSMRDDTMAVMFDLISSQRYQDKFKNIAKRLMIKRKKNRHFPRDSLHKPKRHHSYRRSC